MHFATDDDRRKFDCARCIKVNPGVSRGRRCGEPGYANLPKPMAVDRLGFPVPFCPGKARWSEDMAEIFGQCLILAETGMAPKQGALEDQSDILNEVLPIFLVRYRERTYQRVWSDVREWSKVVLEAALGKKK